MSSSPVPAHGSGRNGVVALVVGVLLVIVAQFPLDPLADSSDTWHMIQHGTFFVGGIAVGIGLTLLFRAGQRHI
ncbi:MAG: hypothetical protein ACREQM_15710 [Candidatus Dormibacteraceae bacterium]